MKMDEESEVNASQILIPPSVKDHYNDLLAGKSYSHYSFVPKQISINDRLNPSIEGTPCVLGVDEAGRGPVIGPMIYGVFYLPIEQHHALLSTTHHFDDSKVLTPEVRATLMKSICSINTDLYDTCGWAIRSLSAQDISAGMLKNGGSYNLNAQAMDATIELIRGVIELNINIQEIYIDTIGNPIVYQKKLEKIFPTIKITVEKKADSLYPCVSAASVVAKVTRDVCCEELFGTYKGENEKSSTEDQQTWGSGYPSDSKCINWLKHEINPVFGWGNECRFSWGTVKDMLELKGMGTKVDWPIDNDPENTTISNYFSANNNGQQSEGDDLRMWFGSGVRQEAF